MTRQDYEHGVFVLNDFVTASECEAFIERSESYGFEEAAINNRGTQEIVKSVRNNDRILFDDETLAETLFPKIKPHVPECIDDWCIFGLNERFRFYKYQPGQYFKWHRDGAFERHPTEKSFFTFMIYLNDHFSGGITKFREFSVTPQTGSALVFPHRVMHEGAEIESGTKYVLRTDVMYRKW